MFYKTTVISQALMRLGQFLLCALKKIKSTPVNNTCFKEAIKMKITNYGKANGKDYILKLK